MKIMVTGATGQFGTKVVNSLLKMIPANQLAVSVRTPEKAEGLKAQGVEVRQGDFSKPETLDFTGIDKLLIIPTSDVVPGDEVRISQHMNAVDAAVRDNVKFIAFTSAPKADISSFCLAPAYKATEAAILKTGIPYTFLRNNWYLENEIGSIQTAMAGAPWITAVGNGKIGWVLRQDLAEATAVVLAGNGHENTIYELSGRPRTQEELVSAIESVLEKEIPLQKVSDVEYADIMKSAGVPEAALPMMVEIQKGMREGALEVESNDLENLLGHPATPINEALIKLINDIIPATNK